MRIEQLREEIYWLNQVIADGGNPERIAFLIGKRSVLRDELEALLGIDRPADSTILDNTQRVN